MKPKNKIIKPLTGNQYDAIRSNADFVVMTGAGNSGKSFALGYAPISYLYENQGSKIIWFMRNVSDFFDAGKVADTLKEIYPLVDRRFKIQPHNPIGEVIKSQEDMGVKFYNGSEIKFQHLANENKEAIDKIFKGLQVKKALFEECNKFSWNTISTCQTRLRANTKGKAQIYLAQNPERECFVRRLCGSSKNGGGWIDEDGSPIESMNGKIRYFHIVKGNLDEVYWGDTKEEVYDKCKSIIDNLLVGNDDMSYEDFILSMVFYTFDMRDNKEMLAKNKKYRAMTATSVLADSMYKPNWNFSILDEKTETTEEENDVTSEDIENLFINRGKTSGKKHITVDMASTGLDNLVMMYWEGFQCKDIAYNEKNTNFEAVRLIKQFMIRHDCDDSNLIIDIQGFGFLKDVFNLGNSGYGGYAFSGSTIPSNRGRKSYEKFKDEAAHLAQQMIKARLIGFDTRLANMRYTHQKMKREATTIKKHLVFESAIFSFQKTAGDKLKFLGKIKQHSHLRGMSPDLTDNIIMLCGALCYDCYRELAQLTGEERKKMRSSDLIDFINVDNEYQPNRQQRRIENSDRILKIISAI